MFKEMLSPITRLQAPPVPAWPRLWSDATADGTCSSQRRHSF